ncbi:hypothetical protein KEM54_004669, partial [Ascosphaera aggregata]
MSLAVFFRAALRASSSSSSSAAASSSSFIAPLAATAVIRNFTKTALKTGDSSLVQAENEKSIATKTYKQNSHLPETTKDGLDHNTPDYYARVDHGTS